MRYELLGHVLEFGTGCSNLDPWCGAYCDEIGLPMMVFADIVSYVLIDEEDIYRLRYSSSLTMQDWLYEANDVFKSWDEFMKFFEKDLERYVGKLSEMKKDLYRYKIQQEEFKKLSPEERKAEIARRREERKKQIEDEKRRQGN